MRPSKRLWSTSLLALSTAAACTAESPGPDAEPAAAGARAGVAAATAPPPAPAPYPLIRTAPQDPRRPAEPYVDRGVCPFECCVYREWIAHAPVRAYARERDTTAVAFTLRPGERFDALTGNVHLDRVGVAVVQRSVTWREGPDSIGRFEPGDTVYVLSYLGEDYYRMWHRGRIVDFSRIWSHPEMDDPEPVAAHLIQEPREDWWVRVQSQDRRLGWLRMAEAAEHVGKMDACSVD